MADIDEERRQRRMALAEQGRRAGQDAWRAKAHTHNARRRAVDDRRQLADALIQEWDRRLSSYALTLQDPERGPAWADARRTLVAFGTMLQQQPDAVQVLRERGEASGWEKQPYLESVLASEEPGRAIDRMLKVVEEDGADRPPHPHAADKEQIVAERTPAQAMVR